MFSILPYYTKLNLSIDRYVPIIYLAWFLGAWDVSLNKNKDPSFHSGEAKRQQDLEKTDNKQ